MHVVLVVTVRVRRGDAYGVAVHGWWRQGGAVGGGQRRRRRRRRLSGLFAGVDLVELQQRQRVGVQHRRGGHVERKATVSLDSNDAKTQLDL